ncbi:MAG: hypothetical protein K2L96_05745 [Muribaculaceae bacterium]|nr:hypothetical protein [Muribaculaceae bacterium]
MKHAIFAAILILILTGCRSAKEARTSEELQATEEVTAGCRIEIVRDELHSSLGRMEIELDSVMICGADGTKLEAQRARIVARSKRKSLVTEAVVSEDSVWSISTSHEIKENIEKRDRRKNPWLSIILTVAIAALVGWIIWRNRT